MALPRRFSWHIAEASARWGCYPADIIDWSLRGDLEICTAVQTVGTTHGDQNGIMVVPPEDFVRMFRRDGTGPKLSTVRRIRQPGPDHHWMRITEPATGVHLEAGDLFITQDELDRFEEAHELVPKPRNVASGPATKWDWDGFYTALIRRIHEHGMPDQQKDLVEEMTGWFERRSPTGDAPDPSTIRKKVAGVWRELREAD